MPLDVEISQTLIQETPVNITLDPEPHKKGILIKADLYERLVTTQVLDPHCHVATEIDEVELDQETSAQFQNGFTFSRYMLALKIIMVSPPSNLALRNEMRIRT